MSGGTSPVLPGIQAGFSGCPSAGSSQPLAGFYSTPVLISLRWHGGEADLIIVMVAGGSEWLQTSATASHIRVLRRLGYSSCLITGLPMALVLCSPSRQHLHRDFFQTRTIWDASLLGNSGAHLVRAAKLFLRGQLRESPSGLLLPSPTPLLLRGTVYVHVPANLGVILLIFPLGGVVVSGAAAAFLLNPLGVLPGSPSGWRVFVCCWSTVCLETAPRRDEETAARAETAGLAAL